MFSSTAVKTNHVKKMKNSHVLNELLGTDPNPKGTRLVDSSDEETSRNRSKNREALF